MIDVPVGYCQNCQVIVTAYNSRERQEDDANYWASAEVQPVKKEIKDFYKVKQAYTCSYCAQEIRVKHSRAWDTEHIVARSIRPEFMFEPRNLCIACLDCNLAKGDVNVLVNKNRASYPKNGKGFRIFHAHFDNYDEHIGVIGEKYYFAKSVKGSFTMFHCNLVRFAVESLWNDSTLANTPEALKIADEILSTSTEEAQTMEIKVEVTETDISISINKETKLSVRK